MSEQDERIDSGDTVETDERRMRVNQSLLHLHLPEGAPITALAEWLLAQPTPSDRQSQDPTDLGVAVAASLDRVTWSGAGEPFLFGGRVETYLSAKAVAPDELSLLNRAVAELGPAQVGSWAELDGSTVGFGWVLDGNFALGSALLAATPDCPGLDDLRAWAEKTGAARCTRLRRSMEPLLATELTIPLAGGSTSDQLGAARTAFDMLDKPWPGADLETPLGERGPAGLALVASFSTDGPDRLGVRADGPGPELTLDLCAKFGAADEKTLRELRGVLRSEPAWLACSVRTGAPALELYYTP